jgi:hypothetical protein
MINQQKIHIPNGFFYACAMMRMNTHKPDQISHFFNSALEIIDKSINAFNKCWFHQQFICELKKRVALINGNFPHDKVNTFLVRMVIDNIEQQKIK